MQLQQCPPAPVTLAERSPPWPPAQLPVSVVSAKKHVSPARHFREYCLRKLDLTVFPSLYPLALGRESAFCIYGFVIFLTLHPKL